MLQSEHLFHMCLYLDVKYLLKEGEKCETLCYVADMTKRSGYPHS